MRLLGGRPRLRSHFAHGKKAWFLAHTADRFVRAAHDAHFRSRAAFKILQIDDKFGLLAGDGPILDLGAAPGGWSQAISQRYPARPVVAIDLKPISPIPGVEVHQGDAFDTALLRSIAHRHHRFGAIVSDLAPAFSGHTAETHPEMAELNLQCLKIALVFGAASSGFAGKTLDSPLTKSLVSVMENLYARVARFKPEASRAASEEIFLVGMGLQDRWRTKTTVHALGRSELLGLQSAKAVRQWLEDLHQEEASRTSCAFTGTRPAGCVEGKGQSAG